MNENIEPTFEQESDSNFVTEVAKIELKKLNIEEYQKWFSDNVLFFMENYDKLVEKLKDYNPRYYYYITHKADHDYVKHLDSFTDGIDLLFIMKGASKLKKLVLLLSYQRKYVDDVVTKIKEILNIN